MAKKTDGKTAKMRLLDRLIDSGYSTEESISAMNTTDMLSIPNVTVADIAIICELQNCIKQKKVISWLGGNETVEKAETNKPKKEKTS